MPFSNTFEDNVMNPKRSAGLLHVTNFTLYLHLHHPEILGSVMQMSWLFSEIFDKSRLIFEILFDVVFDFCYPVQTSLAAKHTKIYHLEQQTPAARLLPTCKRTAD